ncbi:cell surface hyaluronidase-like [Branchiostoma floridae]|uniref:hyaluronoglucosaminidase n=1 Tax=Branchiostoma floridae TaxID=7739 RepID=A0A9J7LLC5_BRAFL|nr:cell surface hyaluronidase-like [Branchiostoma floridae]
MSSFTAAVVLLCLLASVLSKDYGCPDADPTLTPWNPGHDPTAQVVVGRGENYLLQSSATFFSLEVRNGGRIVFADLGPTSDEEIVLRSREIIVGSDPGRGEFHIGSETCPYQGKATVSLYGRKDDQKNSKQFLVKRGGTLEIHGQHKLAWTQLTQTVPAGGLPKGSYGWDSTAGSGGRGIHVHVIDETSAAVVDWQRFDTQADESSSRRLASFIDQIPSGKIVALQVYESASGQLKATTRQKIRELGSIEVDALSFRNPWVFVGVKGDPSAAVEQRIPYVDTQTTGRASITATFDAFFGSYDVTATSEWLGGRSRCTFSVNRAGGGDYVINLKDDVSSWQPGDHIVLASTDYNMEQAEEFQLLPCQECSSHQVKISGQARYTHFGEISDDVDLRGEVGLLTRNIKFQGEVEDSCYGDNFCQYFSYDTYGGHLKILQGYKNVHLSGIEFTRMGQQVLGSYPVHFHMAGDVDEVGGYSRPTYVRELSIHHCFSRCLTIHGTHGLLVQDTVGYDTLGHCFFLEDGVEQRNVLDHNLGLVTRAGTLLPTDRDSNMCRSMRDGVYGNHVPTDSECRAVTTFWIAHPNNNLTNNAAAGSLHTGIWYIFHREPTGLSEGALPRKQAEQSPLGRFYNNRAHSNGVDGLMIDEGVKTTQPSANSPEEYLSRRGARYKPHQNSDLLQPRVPAMIEGLISFKNTDHGSWVRGGDIWFNKCAFVDNGKGLTMASEGTFPKDEGSSQQVWNSIFIGESENVGTASGSSVWGMGGVKSVGRSLPKATNFPIRGLEVYDGPILAENCTFKKYASAPEYNRWSGAIGFKLQNSWQTAPNNNLTGIKFEDVQTRAFFGGRYLPFFDTYDKDGDKTQIFHDVDGSTTGHPDTHVVGQDNYLVRNAGCLARPEWRAYVCSGKYAQLFIHASIPGNLVMSMVRDEYPDQPYTLKGPTPQGANGVQKYQPPVMLEKSYTIHWNRRAPQQIIIYPINFNSGDWLRLGLCYPPGTIFRVTYQLENRMEHAIVHDEEVIPVSSLNAVEGGDGKMFYFEESTGLLFLKVRANYDREGCSYCSHMGCERIVITATMTSDAVSDCTAAAYPKYSLTPAETVPMPSFLSMANDCAGCGAPEPIINDDNLKFLQVTIQAAGKEELNLGYRSFIEVDGVRYDDRYRGFRIIAVDALNGSVTHHMTFNTHGQPEADAAMATFIRSDIPNNSIVLVATRDSSERYAQECLTALKEIGAQEPVQTDYRGNFAMIGFKGTVWPSWIQQVNLPSTQGPAQIYTKIPLMA